jgi:uncharacterized protein (TIGR04255 family)
MTEENSTLTKNALKQFILRIDFGILENSLIANIVNIIAPSFDRIEKRIIQGIKFKIDPQSTEVQKNETHDIICVSDVNGMTLTFSERDGSITFESNKYKDKDTYLGVLNSLIEAFGTLDYAGNSRRIGMRFINEFVCDKKSQITKILDKRLANTIRGMLSSDTTSRVIAMEEGTTQEYKSRAQYGIVNKFYPEPIGVYDLILDLDFYIDAPTPHNDFGEAAKTLNKAAFYLFKACINPSYLEKLK